MQDTFQNEYSSSRIQWLGSIALIRILAAISYANVCSYVFAIIVNICFTMVYN